MSLAHHAVCLHALVLEADPPSMPVMIGIMVGVTLVCLIGLGLILAVSYQKVDQGQALIITKSGAASTVSFTGAIVIPIIHRAEVMDISVKTIELDRRGTDGLICADHIRADIKVTFFVRVNPLAADVMAVARAIGVSRASDQATLETLFTAKFSDGLKTVARQLEFQELYTQRAELEASILELLGRELNGYRLDACTIDYLEMTPLEALDPANVSDAKGIRKIKAITDSNR